MAGVGVEGPGFTLTCRGLKASPRVITAHRMRAFLLARATVAFCQPARSLSAAAHFEIGSLRPACGKLRSSFPLRPAETNMSTTLEALQAEVLSLSPKDKARLLDRLIASLDADTEVEAAWDALAAAREMEMNAGTVHPVPLAAALTRLEARFPG